MGLGLHQGFGELNLGGTHFLPGIGFNTRLAPQGGKAWGEERLGRERGRLGGGLGAAGLVGNACHPHLCPHSRDLPPTRKGKLKASPSDM